jgi:hypothetical protein
VGAPRPGQRDAGDRVVRQAPVADGEDEDEDEHAVPLPHRRGREALADELGHPGRHLGMGDVGEPILSPARQELSPQQRPVAVERAVLH